MLVNFPVRSQLGCVHGQTRHIEERAEKKAAHMALIWVQFFLTFPDDFAGHLRQKKNFKDNSTVTVLMFGPVVFSTLGPA
jgi:hypothetical protein